MATFLAHLFNPSRTCFDARAIKYHAFDRNDSIRDSIIIFIVQER